MMKMLNLTTSSIKNKLLKNKTPMRAGKVDLRRDFTTTSYAIVPLSTGFVGLLAGFTFAAILNSKFIKRDILKQKFIVVFRVVTVAYTLSILGFIAGFFLGAVPYLFMSLSDKVNFTLTDHVLLCLDDSTKTALQSLFSKYEVSDWDLILISIYIVLVCIFCTALFIKAIIDRWELMIEFAILTTGWAFIIFLFLKIFFFLAFISYKIFILGDIATVVEILAYVNFVTNPGSTKFASQELWQNLIVYEELNKGLTKDAINQARQWLDFIRNTGLSKSIDPGYTVMLGLNICGEMTRFLTFNQFCSLISVVTYELSPLSTFINGPYSKGTYGYCGLDFRSFVSQGVTSIYITLYSDYLPHDFHKDSALEFLACILNFLLQVTCANNHSNLQVFDSILANAHNYTFMFLLLKLTAAIALYQLFRHKFRNKP